MPSMNAVQASGARPVPLPRGRGTIGPPSRLRAAAQQPAAVVQKAAQRPANLVPGLRKSAILAARNALGGATSSASLAAPPKFETGMVQGIELAGDVNGDGKVTNSDAKDLLNYLFLGADQPKGIGNADLNGDGQVNLVDALRILTQLLQGNSSEETSDA